ncbi:reverse transcriptase-like protein [uncultured Sphingomonas sp.]|uniref:reverse transcriptase-like protein n=1 Tax=uncultured Sphingomonas sp. TaxID=158754 RepID=UPI0035CA0A43
MPRDRLPVFFDGGCRPNPGAMELAVVLGGRTYRRADLGEGDSNEAEWLALLHAVGLAAAAGGRDVVFVGDSALVIGQARGTQRCRDPRLQVHLDAFHAAVAAIPRHRFRQVPRSRNLAGIALARSRPDDLDR